MTPKLQNELAELLTECQTILHKMKNIELVIQGIQSGNCLVQTKLNGNYHEENMIDVETDILVILETKLVKLRKRYENLGKELDR